MAAQAAAILRSKRKRYEIELLLSPRTEIILCYVNFEYGSERIL